MFFRKNLTQVSWPSEAEEPLSATPADGRGNGNGLDVGDGCGTTEDAHVSGEGGLEAGPALFALQGLDQGGLLAADVGTRAAVDKHVKVVAGAARVLAQEALGVSLEGGKKTTV